MPLGRHHKDATIWLQPSIICGTLDALIPADHGLRVGNACSRGNQAWGAGTLAAVDREGGAGMVRMA